jgi:multimeric flavodoxin WrbA
MSKKVLVLPGSPRKHGNSDLLCDQFVLGAREAGNEAEKIVLRDKKIHFCTGCGVCVEKGAYVQKDDMAEILQKMIAADVIVMATPVYFYTMNGQMKTLIDRTCPVYTKLTNKQYYFIMTAADGRKRTLDGFRGFTSCLTRAEEKGVIYGTGAWRAGEIQGSKAMGQAYELGKQV